MFVVELARVGFDTSGATSLKEKRRVRNALRDRVRRRFPVAIAEIESNDNHAVLVLGLAVVSNDSAHAASMVDKVVHYMESLYLAPLIYREREVINLGSLEEPFWDTSDDVDLDWEHVTRQVTPLSSDSPSAAHPDSPKE